MWRKWIWITLVGVILMILLFPKQIESPETLVAVPIGDQVCLMKGYENVGRQGFSGPTDFYNRNEFQMMNKNGQLQKPFTSVFGNIKDVLAFEGRLWMFWENGGASCMDLDLPDRANNRDQEAYPAPLSKEWNVPIAAATVHKDQLFIFGEKNGYVVFSAMSKGVWSTPATYGFRPKEKDAEISKVFRDKDRFIAAFSDGKDRILLVWASESEPPNKTVDFGCGLMDVDGGSIYNYTTIKNIKKHSVLSMFTAADGRFACIQLEPPQMFSGTQTAISLAIFDNNQWSNFMPIPPGAFSQPLNAPHSLACWSANGRDYLAFLSNKEGVVYERNKEKWVLFSKPEIPSEQGKPSLFMISTW